MSEVSVDAAASPATANVAPQPLPIVAAGGNPRISAPLQNSSLGAGAGLAATILKPKSHQENIITQLVAFFAYLKREVKIINVG